MSDIYKVDLNSRLLLVLGRLICNWFFLQRAEVAPQKDRFSGTDALF